MDNFFVYIILNKINGKIYIGKTNNLEKRWYHHIWAANNNVNFHLYKSMRKYGFDNFIIEVFESHKTEQEAFDAEIFWITYYKVIGASLLNETFGGEGVVGRKVSNETKQKMSLAHMGNTATLGYKHTEKSKQKMSKSQAGRKHNEQTKLKMSRSQSGKNNAMFDKGIKIIDQFGNIYINISQAVKLTGVTHHSIRLMLNGKRKSNKKGFIFSIFV